MLNRHTITKEEHLKWFSSLRYSNQYKFWVVYVDKVPIGTVYMQDINYTKKTSEWGFYIGENNYIGKGYGKRVLLKFLQIFFDKLGFEKLITRVTVDNNIAIKLYRGLGFRTIREKGGVIVMEYKEEDLIKMKRKEELNI
ncbi:hypothetical protein ES708_20556 [subsurface metagenome]